MMPDLPRERSAPKLLGLEVLRFGAAFSVLIWHYQHFTYVADQPVDLVRSRMPFYGLFWPFYEAGHYGVWVFWCISGFIFFWKYRDQIHDRALGGWQFFVLRFSRLYPLHIATLLVVAILQSLHFRAQGNWFVYQDNDLPHFLLQLALATGWGATPDLSFNGPIWSISVEVLVYITFFLVLRHLTKSVLLNIVVIILCMNVHGQVFSCLAFFYAGGLAATARRLIETTTYEASIGFVSAAVVAIGCACAWQFGALAGRFDWLLFLALTPIALIGLSGDLKLPSRIESVVAAAGNTTYSSYLLHFPLQLAISLGFGWLERPLAFDAQWFFITYVVVTLIASYLTFRYFEMPAQRFLRTRLLQRTPCALGAPLVKTR